MAVVCFFHFEKLLFCKDFTLSVSDIMDKPTQESYSQIIELIFQNAQESIENIERNIRDINTTLSAITGFSVLLIKFVGDLPDSSLEITTSDLTVSLSCYSCLLFKIISLILLVTSTLISLKALLPPKTGRDLLISPTEQVEKSLELSEDEYKLLFIKQYERDIESLVERRDRKVIQLNQSGTTFVVAAIFSALDLLLEIFLTSFS